MLKYKRIIKSNEIDLKERVVSINRVTKVVKGGRNFSFSTVVVVGNKKGVIGYGLGKANEVTSSILKGIEDAKKKLVKIPIIKGTISHNVLGRFKGSIVFLRPAGLGTGIIAGGGIRFIMEVLGVNNILSKSKGSSNSHNIVKATFAALLQIRDPLTVALHRGVSIYKVFKG